MTHAQPPKPSSPSSPKPAQLVRGPEWGKRRVVETIAPFRAGDPVGKSLGYTVTKYGWDEDELGDLDSEEMPNLAREFIQSSCEFCSAAYYQDPGSEHLHVAAGQLAALCEQLTFYGRRLGLGVEGLIAFRGLLDRWVQLRGRARINGLEAARGSATQDVDAIRVRACVSVQGHAGGTVPTEAQARDSVMSPRGDPEVDDSANENDGPCAQSHEEKSASAEDQLKATVHKVLKRTKWRRDLSSLSGLGAVNRGTRVKAAKLAATVGSSTAATQKRLRRERVAGLVEGGQAGWWMSSFGLQVHGRLQSFQSMIAGERVDVDCDG